MGNVEGWTRPWSLVRLGEVFLERRHAAHRPHLGLAPGDGDGRWSGDKVLVRRDTGFTMHHKTWGPGV